MKTKTFSLTIAGLLAVALLLSFAGASISLSSVGGLSQTESSFDVEVTSNETELITLSVAPIEYGGKTITFTSTSQSVTNDTATTFTVGYTIESGFEFELGQDYTSTLTAEGSISSENSTQTIEFEDPDYCEYNDEGNLDLSIDDIDTISGYGDDDDYWYLGDEVRITLELENNGNEDIEKLEIEWCLFDEENNECVLDDEEGDLDVDEDDTENVEFTIFLDPEEFDADSEDYTLYVRATGEVQDDNDTDTCSSDFDSIDINIEDDFVVLTDIEFRETVSCGANLLISGEAWNIGSDDQEDVMIFVYNQDLGISEEFEMGDIDSLESESFEFTIEIPSDAEEKTHNIKLQVYDDDNEIFENKEDDKSEETLVVEISGGCYGTPSASISGEVLQEGRVGDELVLEISLTNTGEKSATYNLKASGFSEWAESADFSLSNVVAGPGQEVSAELTFMIKEDVEKGDYTFNIEAISADETVSTQMFEVSIEKGFWNWNLDWDLGDNWYIWLIIGLNVLLVFIIIIVAIRVSRS